MTMATTNLTPDELFVKRALVSLYYRAVDIDGNALEDWFERAFNHWFCPLCRRGYWGPFSTVFDIGNLLTRPVRWRTQPPSGMDQNNVQRFQAYARFLKDLSYSPFIELARTVWSEAPAAAKPHVERLLIESVLGEFERPQPVQAGTQPTAPLSENAPSQSKPRHEESEPFELLPLVKVDAGKKLLVLRGPASSKQPSDVYKSDKLELQLPPDGTAPPKCFPGETSESLGPAAPAPGGTAPPEYFPRVPEGQTASQMLDRVRIFMAHVVCRNPSALSLLDYEVVQACLTGPNLRPEEHQPPKLLRTEHEPVTKSQLPGRVGGVTRIELKSEDDPFYRVIPSEWLLYVMAEPAGLQKMMIVPPQVTKLELEYDIVPRHRALVCFMVEAGAEGEPVKTDRSVQPFRHPYVFAKRQVFDLIRDLRDGMEKLRYRDSVKVDVAVFVLRDSSSDALVHRFFHLDPKKFPAPKGSDDRFNRLQEMTRFDDLFPLYFCRLPRLGRTMEEASKQARAEDPTTGPRGSSSRLFETLDPRPDHFLRHLDRRRETYHRIHIVPIGSFDYLDKFVPTTVEEYRLHRLPMAGRFRVMLIEVDQGPRGDPPRELDREPVWKMGQARSVSEAARLLGSSAFLRQRSLGELRYEFVEMVLGEIKSQRGSIRRTPEFV